MGETMIFHWLPGGSGEIRGRQMQEYLGMSEGAHVYVKMQPPENVSPHSYLDVLDAHERIAWLLEHPTMGVIASSETGVEYLGKLLGRSDIHLIPQHHCNYDRIKREGDGIRVAGVVGGKGAIQCDVEVLTDLLCLEGIEFRWLQHYKDREDVVAFYQELDLQVVWRLQPRRLKNPLKLVNAMSFGIPTIAYPEPAYQEVNGYYWPARTMAELMDAVTELRRGFDATRLIAKAEQYHIEKIAHLYRELDA